MLRLGSTFVAGFLLLELGCSKKDTAPQHPPPRPQPPSRLDSGPGTSVAQALVPTVPALPQPLTEGKRVRIDKLWVPPVEITVPPNFTLNTDATEEVSPHAHLEGPDWEVEVREPEGGFRNLKREKRMLLRSDSAVKIIHEQETAAGFLLIDQDNLDGPSKYTTWVTRPALKVECVAWGMDSLADAEKGASICLTLGRARRGKWRGLFD